MIPKDVRDHLNDDVGDDPVYVLAHLYCLQKHAIDLAIQTWEPGLKPSVKQVKAVNITLLDIRLALAAMKPAFPFLNKLIHEVLRNGTARVGITPEYLELLGQTMAIVTEEGGPSFVPQLQ